MRRKRSPTHPAAQQPRPQRRVGRALRKAYTGKLEEPPTTAERENLVRVRWVR